MEIHFIFHYTELWGRTKMPFGCFPEAKYMHHQISLQHWGFGAAAAQQASVLLFQSIFPLLLKNTCRHLWISATPVPQEMTVWRGRSSTKMPGWKQGGHWATIILQSCCEAKDIKVCQAACAHLLGAHFLASSAHFCLLFRWAHQGCAEIWWQMQKQRILLWHHISHFLFLHLLRH